jgi:LPXTG-motif cell wall-anchored protein
MYTGAKGAGVVAATGAAVVTTLPNTGSSLMVSTAVAVAAGMLAWGVVYARTR